MPRKERFRNVGAGKGIKQQLDPDRLQRLYVKERQTLKQIANDYGCTPQFVSLLVKEYGIRRPPPKSSKSL